MKTIVDGLYKLTDYQFYLFSINCKLQIAIFTVFTVKTKNFGHLYWTLNTPFPECRFSICSALF